MRTFILSILFLSTSSFAQSWQAIDDPAELTALMNGTVMEATLKDGVRATAKYNADGTGVLEAWGEKFKRSWEVKNSQICITQQTAITCYRVEKSADNTLHRAENLTTGEILEIAVSGNDSPTQIDSANKDEGGAAKPSAEEIAAALANPNTPMATITFKLQQRSFEGGLPNSNDQHSTTLLFQPGLPFVVGDGQVFFRPALPIIRGQPLFNDATGDFDEESGFGDLAFDLAYGKTTDTGVLWATGIIASLPIGSDGLTSDLYTLGPEVLIGKITKKWVVGAFPNHQWDIGGSGKGDINLTTLQLFGTIIGSGGWTYGSSPIMSYDHNAEQWTIPINLNVGKTVIQGNGRPWKLGFEVNYYTEKPDSFGPDWMVGFSIAPVIENPLAKWFQ
jgi:hypothetical protein